MTATLTDWRDAWRRRRNPEAEVAPSLAAAARGRRAWLPAAVRRWLADHELEAPSDPEGRSR
eukprot:9167838-Alexandrium_andersonii.AAC.1